MKSNIQYIDGLREGISVEYYENGKRKVIHSWMNDTLEGETRVYNEHGCLVEVVNFKKGILDGEFYNYFQTGNIRMRGNYNEGIMHGKVIQYFEKDSGRVQAEINYLNFQGLQKDFGSIWYDSLGNIIRDIRRIELKSKRDTFYLGETMELGIELKNPRFDTTFFVLGDYDKKFLVKDSAKFDTLNAVNQKYTLIKNVIKKGDNFIRGYSMNYRTLETTKDETTQEFILPIYFEYGYFVK